MTQDNQRFGVQSLLYNCNSACDCIAFSAFTPYFLKLLIIELFSAAICVISSIISSELSSPIYLPYTNRSGTRVLINNKSIKFLLKRLLRLLDSTPKL